MLGISQDRHKALHFEVSGLTRKESMVSIGLPLSCSANSAQHAHHILSRSQQRCSDKACVLHCSLNAPYELIISFIKKLTLRASVQSVLYSPLLRKQCRHLPGGLHHVEPTSILSLAFMTKLRGEWGRRQKKALLGRSSVHCLVQLPRASVHSSVNPEFEAGDLQPSFLSNSPPGLGFGVAVGGAGCCPATHLSLSPASMAKDLFGFPVLVFCLLSSYAPGKWPSH